MDKEKVTFSVDRKVMRGFRKYCKDNGYTMSKKIEILITKLLKR